MPYDARQIANWFIERAQKDGKSLSVMALLKLTYIAHGWHLEMFKAPLFGDRIEAWKYGPVIPDVYNKFRSQRLDVRTPVYREGDVNPKDDPRVNDFLDEVWEIYGDLSPFYLSDLTHAHGGPWDIVTKTGVHYAPIPNELIQQYYMLKRVEDNKRRQANNHV